MIISLTLLGQLLELKARSQTSAAIKLASRPGAEDGAAHRRRRQRGRHPAGARARRRHAARSPGREGAGRRRRRRRQQRGRRIDAHRRADAGRQAQRRQADRRDDEHQRRAGHARGVGRLAARCWRRSSRWSSQAQRTRAPMQRLADRVAGYFVVVVIASAVLTFFAWGLFGPQPSWVYGLVNAVAVLIIACPCALGLATPMSIMVATGKAATQGILFRDAAAIENLRRVDTLVVDKTGTLTEGRPQVRSRRACRRATATTRCCASPPAIDQGSEHPLALAIVRAARERGLKLETPERFESEHRHRRARHARRQGGGARERGLDEARPASRSTRWPPTRSRCAQEGASVMSPGGRRSPRRPARGLRSDQGDARAEALASLKARGIRIVMATGDGADDRRAVAAPARHRRGARRGRAGRQARAGRAAAARGPGRRDGRRRHQRRPRAGQGRRRHRDGHRHRRGDEQRRRSRSSRATCAASPRRGDLARRRSPT